jgi:hypothetical protein
MDAFITLIVAFAIPTAIVAVIFVGLLFYVLPREVRTIFKRELKSYFTSPIAYVLFVVFLGSRAAPPRSWRWAPPRRGTSARATTAPRRSQRAARRR